jgi:hypothetical protein
MIVTHITLKGLAFVDGKDEDHILACFECFFEDWSVLSLRCPDTLILFSEKSS